MIPSGWSANWRGGSYAGRDRGYRAGRGVRVLLLAVLSPALAVTVDAGVGYRRTLDLLDGAPMGLHAFARAAVDAPVWDHFAVEVRA